ncbi:IS21 family transposase, partial [Thorsellia kenyensis]
MSTVPISMRKLKEILRLKFDAKLPHRRIAQSLSISASTVSYYVNRAGQLGITWPIPSDLNDRDLEHAFQSTQVKIKQPRYPVPDWVEIKNQLTNKTITLQFLWDEYASKSTYHYSYPQFCRLYKQWLKKQKLSMRQHHIAGEKLFVDYCGPTVNIVDPTTHEIIKAQIFVAVMGASSYTYAEATHSQNLENWIMSHVRCFEFLGGVPSIIIPDNLKSAVTKASRYEPDLNPTYQQLAAYYGTTVLPTRPYKPKDKAKVEVAVQVVERWIIARLRHETFYSLAQLNASIRALIDELNARQLQKRTDSRRSLFQSIDLPALQALPARPYVFTQVKKTRVPSDYHIEVEQYFYSVPYQLAKELVEVYISGQLVEIYHHGTLAARHPRQHQAGLHTTQLAHCPLV